MGTGKFANEPSFPWQGLDWPGWAKTRPAPRLGAPAARVVLPGPEPDHTKTGYHAQPAHPPPTAPRIRSRAKSRSRAADKQHPCPPCPTLRTRKRSRSKTQFAFIFRLRYVRSLALPTMAWSLQKQKHVAYKKRMPARRGPEDRGASRSGRLSRIQLVRKLPPTQGICTQSAFSENLLCSFCFFEGRPLTPAGTGRYHKSWFPQSRFYHRLKFLLIRVASFPLFAVFFL